MSETVSSAQSRTIDGRLISFTNGVICAEFASAGNAPKQLHIYASGRFLGAADTTLAVPDQSKYTAQLAVDSVLDLEEPISISGILAETGDQIEGRLEFENMLSLISKAGLLKGRLLGLEGGSLHGEINFGSARRQTTIVVAIGGHPQAEHVITPVDSPDGLTPFSLKLPEAALEAKQDSISAWFKFGAAPLDGSPIHLASPEVTYEANFLSQLRSMNSDLEKQRSQLDACIAQVNQFNPRAQRDELFSFIDALLRIHRQNIRAELRSLKDQVEAKADRQINQRGQFQPKVITVDSPEFIGTGWYGLERPPEAPAFRWLGSFASCLLVFTANESLSLIVEGDSFINVQSVNDLRLFVNDVELPASIERLNGKRWRATAMIPEHIAASDDIHTLILETRGAQKPPGGTDHRSLSVSINSITIAKWEGAGVEPPTKRRPSPAGAAEALRKLLPKPLTPP